MLVYLEVWNIYIMAPFKAVLFKVLIQLYILLRSIQRQSFALTVQVTSDPIRQERCDNKTLEMQQIESILQLLSLMYLGSGSELSKVWFVFRLQDMDGHHD
ncbi:hypothetical protein ILYODFUR_017941 [Ilyodon furcidens]|uniref:Uncharacterized protein n=1 Tax=Ilyodon furcidens TaxID=33524 RepID=A0ABV0VEW6_9TELE